METEVCNGSCRLLQKAGGCADATSGPAVRVPIVCDLSG